MSLQEELAYDTLPMIQTPQEKIAVSPAFDPLDAGAGDGKALAADAGALAEGGLGGVNLGAGKASEDSSRCKLNALEMQIKCIRDETAWMTSKL